VSTTSESTSSQRIAPIIDPGWLFLIAGIGILGSVILLPAFEEVSQARFKRDQVLTVEKHRDVRISRYEEFIDAVDSRDPTLIVSLAESQLNQIPIDRAAFTSTFPDPSKKTGDVDASIFPSLEPDPLVLPEREKVVSRLEALTTNAASRPWLTLIGGVCVFVGLLPWGAGTGRTGSAAGSKRDDGAVASS